MLGHGIGGSGGRGGDLGSIRSYRTDGIRAGTGGRRHRFRSGEGHRVDEDLRFGEGFVEIAAEIVEWDRGEIRRRERL